MFVLKCEINTGTQTFNYENQDIPPPPQPQRVEYTPKLHDGNTLRSLALFILTTSIVGFLAVTGCRKDHLLIEPQHRDLALEFTRPNQINFFDRGYIAQRNSYLNRLATRGGSSLIDSLYNSLLELEIAHSYVDSLISYAGYPVWYAAQYHAGDSSHAVGIYTMPFVASEDNTTRAVLFSMFVNNTWHHRILGRNSLSLFLQDSISIVTEQSNIPAYILSMLSYDQLLFSTVDSVLLSSYIALKDENVSGSSTVVVRCWTYEIEFCTWHQWGNQAARQEIDEIELTPRAGWWECVPYALWISCPTTPGSAPDYDLPLPIPGGFGSGTGPGGGNPGVPPQGCGQTLGGVPLLCNGQGYHYLYVNLYNQVIQWLTLSQAQWILQNLSYSELYSIWNFFSAYSANTMLNRGLMGVYFTYLMDERVTDPMNEEDFADLLAPYIDGLNLWERNWLAQNINVLDDPDIEDFLLLLNHNDLTSTDHADWLYSAQSLLSDSHPPVLNLIAEDYIHKGLENFANVAHASVSEVAHLQSYVAAERNPDGSDDAYYREFADVSVDLLNADHLVIVNRITDLDKLISNNPYALIDDCIAQNPDLNLQDYYELYNFQVPTSTNEKLNNLPGFELQTIHQGNAAATNVDRYEVVISQLPQGYTKDAMFEEIRLNFANVASGTVDLFESQCESPLPQTFDIGWDFVPYNPAEVNLWNSSNPLNTIFKIDAWADGFNGLLSDPGAIIVSQVETCCFVGSTIKTPETGTQPFSGNRQWGYYTNWTGDMVVYTKAIDRALLPGITLFGQLVNEALGNNDCAMETYYDIANETWKNFQNKVAAFTNNLGGQAYQGIIRRELVDNNKIRNALRSGQTIAHIPCN